MKKKKIFKKKVWRGVFLIILITLATLAVYLLYERKEKQSPFDFDLDLDNFQEVEVQVAPGIIFLAAECRVLPVYVPLEQSLAISRGLNNQTEERPMIHDLIKNILNEAGIKILGIKITHLKQGTYYAELLLEKEGKVLKIDSKPSDALALGLRMGSKVYVKKELLAEHGLDICPPEKGGKREKKEVL